MKEGYLILFGILVGWLARPYGDYLINSIDRYFENRRKSQPVDAIEIPPYLNPHTGRREYTQREDIYGASSSPDMAGYKPRSLEE